MFFIFFYRFLKKNVCISLLDNSLSNSPKNNVESIAKKDPDLEGKFVRDFVGSSIKSGDKVKLLNDIMSGETVSEDVKKALISFRDENSSYYSGIDSDKISSSSLKKGFANFFTKLESKRQEFRSLVLRQYEIRADQFDSFVLGDLKKLDETEISKLVSSEKDMLNFLKPRLKRNNLTRREGIRILDEITDEEGKRRFRALKEPEKHEVAEILLSYERNRRISEIDLQHLFSSGIFTTAEKRQLVHTFIPDITLSSALDLGLIDKDRAEEIKKEVVSKIYKDFSGDPIRKISKVEEILKSISLSDLTVSTKDYFTNEQDLNKLASSAGAFKNLENDLNSVNADYQKSIYESGPLDYDRLVSSIDEIDPSGASLLLKEGLCFDTESTSYKVEKVDRKNGKIQISSIAGVEIADFNTFLAVFRDTNAKRVRKINSLDEFMADIKSGEGGDKWGDYEHQDHNSIVYKESGDKKHQLEYLLGKDGKTLLKIDSVSDNCVVIKRGEFEKNKSGEIYKIKGAEKIKVSFNEFKKIIGAYGFVPDYKLGKDEKSLKSKAEKVKDPGNIKGDIVSKIFNNLSLSELMLGGKLMVDGFTNYMKKGNDLHAARAALTLGKFLPDELRQELQVKVESSENENMDKELKSLGEVDSPQASERIKKWLKNKDTKEYKKEAGLMFMLEKYGSLYVKELYSEKGTFLFYRAFGGKIDDDLYTDVKRECESKQPPIGFSEEYLMHILLKKQCKEQEPGETQYYPKRRSRLHKIYEAKWKTGVTAELEKGTKDASNKRSSESGMKGMLDEMNSGGIANSYGWGPKALTGKGSTMKTLNKGHFSIIFSGALYTTDQMVAKSAKQNTWDAGIPAIIARFSSSVDDIDVFNRTVVEVSKRIQKEYGGEFPDIYNKAKKLYEDGSKIPPVGTEKERFERAKAFFDKYSEPLLNSLHMTNHKDSRYSKTDKVIFLEKDNNTIFRDYYNRCEGWVGERTIKEDAYTDEFTGKGVSGLSDYEFIKTFFKPSSKGFAYEKSAFQVWGEISEDVDSVPDKLFTGDNINSNENRALQKKYLKSKLKDVFAGILGILGTDSGMLKNLNLPTSAVGKSLNKWGINISEDLKTDENTMRNGSDSRIDSKIDQIVNNIIDKRDMTRSVSSVAKETSDKVDKSLK